MASVSRSAESVNHTAPRLPEPTTPHKAEAVAERGAHSREVSPVLKFVGRRLLGAIVALFVASIVIFAGTVILPGDVLHDVKDAAWPHRTRVG